MPWTKTKYPASMKRLPATIRNKAIAIGNAMLKENKKMAEGKVIATAIKRAKEMASIGKTKTKTVASKKRKSTAVVKAKRTVGTKTKKVVKRKSKARMPVVAKKKIKIVSKNKPKKIVQAKATKPVQAKSIAPENEIAPTPKITHGEDLHFIPVAGEEHPVRIDDAHKIEHIFHHDEEVAFHRENQRVKESLATRKSLKPIFRNRGGRR